MKKNEIKQVIVMRKDLNMRKGKMIAQGAHASMKVFFDRAANFKPQTPTAADNQSVQQLEIVEDSIGKIVYTLTMPLTPKMFEWYSGIFTKICVSVNSEEELLDIEKKAREKGLPVALIQDAGKTEFNEPTYTCCAIGPDDSNIIDEITGHLKLL